MLIKKYKPYFILKIILLKAIEIFIIKLNNILEETVFSRSIYCITFFNKVNFNKNLYFSCDMCYTILASVSGLCGGHPAHARLSDSNIMKVTKC